MTGDIYIRLVIYSQPFSTVARAPSFILFNYFIYFNISINYFLLNAIKSYFFLSRGQNLFRNLLLKLSPIHFHVKLFLTELG